MREIVVENDDLRLTLLPDLGAKISSLLGKEDGREHLLQPPGRERRIADYGAPFEQYDTSGFDECFPTVGACSVDAGPELPDHGELWPLAWEARRLGDNALEMEAHGRSHEYTFRRRITLESSTVVLDYEVENTGPSSFPYLWSSHPLLRVSPQDRIVLPSEVESLAVEWSAGQRLSGRAVWDEGLARLGDRSLGWADKLFTGRLREGWCQMSYFGGGSLTFRFDPEQISYVGLWICQGGWPGNGRPGHFTVALEPCTAAFDQLSQAVEAGQAKVLEPGGTNRWQLALEVRSAADPTDPITRATEVGQ